MRSFVAGVGVGDANFEEEWGGGVDGGPKQRRLAGADDRRSCVGGVEYSQKLIRYRIRTRPVPKAPGSLGKV
jgi:hypothetical protein